MVELNDAPDGSERSCNGLRLAKTQSKLADQQVQVFLMGDAVACAKDGRKVPDAYYKVGEMVPGALRRALAGLAAGTAATDKVLVF